MNNAASVSDGKKARNIVGDLNWKLQKLTEQYKGSSNVSSINGNIDDGQRYSKALMS